MKIRADIAALVREGHSDGSIARRLNCSKVTVNRVRRALRLPPATALSRFYAEAVPTGQVRDYRPGLIPLSPAQQADNRARLLAALRGEAA